MTRQEEITLARLVNMQLKVDGLERGTLKRLTKYYKAATKSLLAEVKKARGKSGRLWTNTRLIALLEETQLQHQAIINVMTKQTAAASVAAGKYAYDQMNNIISWDGAVKTFNQVSLTTAQMGQLVTSQKLGGKKLGDWIGEALKPNLFPIVDELKSGVLKGQSYDTITRKIREELDFLPGSKKARDMETVVKTYVQAMQVNAMDDVFQANKDIVKKVEWSAIMENGNTKTGRGTCPRCMALDGNQYPVDSSKKPNMPLHARCRCLWYPVTLTWDELGLDGGEMEDVNQPWVIRDLARKDRKILAYGDTDENYAGFWAKQSRSFQNNAVGPIRAQMIRGGMPMKIIVDAKGNLIPIKDLPKKWQIKPPKPKPIKKKVKPPTKKKKPVVAPKKTKKVEKKEAAPVVAPAVKVRPSMVDLKRAFRKSDEGKEINRKINRLVRVNAKAQEKLASGVLNDDDDAILLLLDQMKRREVTIAKLEKRKDIKKKNLIREGIKPPKGGSINMSRGMLWDDPNNLFSDEADWVWNRTMLEDMLHPDVLDKLPPVKVYMKGHTRAHYKNGRNIIQMGNDITETFIHEYGHHLEWNTPGMYQRALNFRTMRAQGEALTVISGTEVGYADKFFNHYCGRKYDFDSTEIISMGMERMFHDPLDFFETDPEYFEFILKIMWGEE